MRARLSATRRGFTLIELLVVIAIIAVLMGLLFPVVSSVQDRARKTQAANDCSQIVIAVKAYYTEYGKYPVCDIKQGDPNGLGIVLGDPDDQPPLSRGYQNALVFDVLRAIAKGRTPNKDGPWNESPAHGLNPKRVVYFEGRNAKDPAAPFPKNGFGTQGKYDGCYMDPWGREYMVFMDTSYKGALDFFRVYEDQPDQFKGNDQALWVRLGVGAASSGPDRMVGKKTSSSNGDKKLNGSDDVVTWR